MYVCLSVPPHIENNLLVRMLRFISILILGGREVDLCLDLYYLYWGWGKFSFKIIFRGGVVLLRILLILKKNFSLFCGGTLLIFVQHSLIHLHNFFVYLGAV